MCFAQVECLYLIKFKTKKKQFQQKTSGNIQYRCDDRLSGEKKKKYDIHSNSHTQQSLTINDKTIVSV